MFKSNYHMKYDNQIHQERVNQFVRRRELAEIATKKPRQTRLANVLQFLLALFR